MIIKYVKLKNDTLFVAGASKMTLKAGTIVQVRGDETQDCAFHCGGYYSEMTMPLEKLAEYAEFLE